MKKMTVVFPIYKEEDKTYVLLGKQTAQKKMPGVRIGPGGKFEEEKDQTIEDCAVREVLEELGIKISKESLQPIGCVTKDEWQIDCYVTEEAPYVVYENNEELENIQWFDLDHPELFINEMLPGDEAVIQELCAYVKNPTQFKLFRIDKTGNMDLEKFLKNIYNP